MSDVSAWSQGLTVGVAGRGVVSHAGSGLVRLLADRVGLTAALSTALTRPGFTPVHDRGRVLSDLGVVLADGGHRIGDIAVLRDQGELFGSVASMPTAWRTLKEITPTALARVGTARARTRRRVWDLIVARHGRIPPSRTCYGDLGDVVVIRLDASVVVSYSEKENAAPTFKKTYGFHPLTAWCDNTGEALAIKLRPGNAGSNTATDHLQVLGETITQIPAKHRRRLLVTLDGAGASHAVVAHLSDLNARPGFQVHYSIGFALDTRARTAIGKLPASAWEPALDAHGEARKDADVAELTGLLRHSHGGDQLAGWPPDMRVLVRREPISPGAQVSLFEQLDGHRYQLIATNTPGGQTQRLEARHRVHARVEDRIRTGKAPPQAGGTPSGPNSDALPQLRDQHRLVRRRRDRRGPPCLDQAAHPGRRPRQSRTRDHALPAPTRRRPPGPRRAPATPEDPTVLALGRRPGPRIHPRPRLPRPHLTPTAPSRQPQQHPPAVEPATPDRHPGRSVTPRCHNHPSRTADTVRP